jgi:hypothetical protein
VRRVAKVESSGVRSKNNKSFIDLCGSESDEELGSSFVTPCIVKTTSSRKKL